MKYPAYPEYEDSGVTWIGLKPKHWQVMKLHHMVRMKSGSSITSLDMDDEGQYPVFGGNGNRGWFSDYTHEGAYVLIGRQGAECGNINYAHGRFWASEHAVVAAPDRELEYRWLGETLRAMNLNQYSQSAAQPGLSVEVIGRLKLPFPPILEQQQIAAFLDWKTAQIDALIAKKQELIAKLKEKRLAVITQAVTKGLNPAAPLRDSGIPWLGMVPGHWEVKRLRFLLCDRFSNGLFKKAEFWGDGVRIVNVTDLYIHNDLVDETRLERLECNADELQTYSATHGDFFVVRSSLKLEGIGKSAALLNPSEATVFECHIVRGRPNLDEAHPRFLNLFLNSTYARKYFMTRANVVTMATIDQEKIKNLVVALPGYDEQQQIAEYLDQQLTRLDSMVTATETAIEKLTEYRTALITAATTGMIDVRSLSPTPLPPAGEGLAA